MKEEPQTASDRREDLLVRVFVPLAVALILIGASLAERRGVAHDLQLIAPREALAGTSIPLRAFVLDLRSAHPSGIDGATLEVSLLPTDESRVLARATLASSMSFGYEGELTLPRATGTFLLHAVARQPSEEELDEARRRIRVHPSAAEAPRRGRLQTELQRFEPYERRGPAPPEHLELRVIGGDCPNHAPCELLVWVGNPPARIVLEPEVGAADAECEAWLTSGIVRCQVRTRGNEAIVNVIAQREELQVGSRRVQLPMGTAAPSVRRESALLPVGARPTYRVDGLDDRYILDLFHEGRWVHTASLELQGVQSAPPDAVRSGAVASPFAMEAPGLWRAQLRRDIFGADSAAVVTHWVARPGESAAATLQAIAAHARQQEWPDPLAAGLRAGQWSCEPADSPPCDHARVAAYLLAPGELQISTYPRASSGAEQASAGVRTVQWGRRVAAASLIFLAGLLVAFVIFRRATRAGVQARAILAAGADEADEVPAPRRDYVPLASAGFLVLLFAVVAAIILARGCITG